ncbi:DUF1156 domain-containing protein [Desulfobacter postgatei]|uniref:DUF1156 domain-containing protein n=1 Tax=Desulfobacter postgatei TaxID=2293 RepID=UPI00259B383A|nr:DUF1156 domain-containing protein [uncultured Desulfobacter sp.]
MKKKLIEVALPLDAINKACAREKSIRHGHPSTLHLWWARRPLAAARAVIFAQMVDDPSGHPDLFPTETDQEKERKRLCDIIEELVLWENTTNETVLEKAREEIRKSWRRTCQENAGHPRAAELFNPDVLPAFHDPFAGGGSLPLEAQRLGLESYASDLNPVAVLINKAMIEIPPKFAGRPPVNPEWQEKPDSEKALTIWKGAQGLAEDVRYYGKWMRDEAEKRIGHLYPKIKITPEMVEDRPDLEPYEGKELTVIAWIWARTVKSPNPAFADVDVPLASTFMLSTKKGKEAYVEPVIEGGGYRFIVKIGKPKNLAAAKSGTKAGRGANFTCLMSGTPISGDYVKAEGKAKRMQACMMAIIAEGNRGRVYLSPTPEMEQIAKTANPTWKPEGQIAKRMTGGNCTPYGLTSWGDLFTSRQLVALATFSDLVQEAIGQIKKDAINVGMSCDGKSSENAGFDAYADALSVYLAFGIDRLADRSSSICSWDTGYTKIRNTFGRQAIPMVWDYSEGNVFSTSTGNFTSLLEWIIKFLNQSFSLKKGRALQEDASIQSISSKKIISIDPPYYDNIGYADLSDFFYVWIRHSIKNIFPNLFATMAVPKAEELVANPYRHGSKENAELFFLNGMTQAMKQLSIQSHSGFPVTIYYAFKQSEKNGTTGITNTGWDTFLAAVIEAGFALTGTWPLRTELGNRMIGSGTNALASSIVLVCQKRPEEAPITTRREFVAALKYELPQALTHLQKGNIAPVDLAQAAIGPGMAVFTRYEKVLDAQGKALTVREALALINQTLDETLAEQEGDFDADSRWALTWFDQMGFEEGEYGMAEQLSKSKNTSVSGLVEAGILISKGGKVRLLTPDELDPDWNPLSDKRLTVWEMVHHLIRALHQGETAAADLVAKLGAQAEVARELCYRLYTLCERKKRASEAIAYNSLVESWPEITRLAREVKSKTSRQEEPELF